MDRIEAAINKLCHLHTEITFDKIKAILTSKTDKNTACSVPDKVDVIAKFCQQQLQALARLIPDQEQFKSGGLYS